jgi:dUTPase
MQIKIKRIDKSLPLPAYQTEGAVAFDLYSRIDCVILPKTVERLPHKRYYCYTKRLYVGN